MSGACRPGGLALTDRMLAACAFPPGARVLDLGCGAGTSVAHLRRRGLEAWGLDRDRAALRGLGPFAPGGEAGSPGVPAAPAGSVVCARGERLPFATGALDGVLMECSLSVADAPDRVLAQCRRALRPGGRLALADLYARGPEAPQASIRLETRGALALRLEAHGFQVQRFEDCTRLLQAFFCQLILDPGAGGGRALAGSDPAALRAAKAGYCLLVARREARP